VTGYLATGVTSAVKALARAVRLDRSAVRSRAEARFGVERMAHDYLEVYRRVLDLPR
jgi:hypothetical protein